MAATGDGLQLTLDPNMLLNSLTLAAVLWVAKATWQTEKRLTRIEAHLWPNHHPGE